jgi:hypothetical protein
MSQISSPILILCIPTNCYIPWAHGRFPSPFLYPTHYPWFISSLTSVWDIQDHPLTHLLDSEHKLMTAFMCLCIHVSPIPSSFSFPLITQIRFSQVSLGQGLYMEVVYQVLEDGEWCQEVSWIYRQVFTVNSVIPHSHPSISVLTSPVPIGRSLPPPIPSPNLLPSTLQQFYGSTTHGTVPCLTP